MHRLYIAPTIFDSRASLKKIALNSLRLTQKVGAVYLADCYTIDKKLNTAQLKKASALLTNLLIETSSTSLLALNLKRYTLAIEIGFLPGVTDNVGATARETLEDGLKIKFKPGENVYSSQVLFIDVKKTSPQPSPHKEREKILLADASIIADSLYNPLIQKATIKTAKQIKKDGCVNSNIPKVKLTASSKVSFIDLNVSDEELEKLGKYGIKNINGTRRGPLALSLDYLKTIADYFNKLGRSPTDIELETLAQTWSEHCKHTIFADPIDEIKDGLYKHYIKGATKEICSRRERFKTVPYENKNDNFCVSVFTDNSGGIVFDDEYLITHKVETHNTPSALDPFGGSITGIVGVNRDCIGFGLGAKPIINIYGFCLAEPTNKTELYRTLPVGNGFKPFPTENNKMLSAKRILDGVVAGVNAGGNQSGIPTNLGFVYFDHLYRGKPLVFAGTVGLIPRVINKKPSHIKKIKNGYLIIMVGGRVGIDGIHGATFSSESLESHSPATAVQIGDPITQKKLTDAIIKEARDSGLYSAITDCGAGGLSSAVGEMAQITNGCEVFLDKVPLKYPGLSPWQIWISESQERMVLAVPPKKWKKFFTLMQKRGVEATIIGKFSNHKKCVVKFGKQIVLNLDMDFLHNGRPIKQQMTSSLCSQPIYGLLEQPMNRLTTNLTKNILQLLSRPNICSFEYISKQYDHEVQSGSVLKPLQGAGRINSDATITRPVLNSNKGVVLANALYPSYSELDCYKMAAASIDGSVRAAVAAGADINYLALLDNFCWSSSNNPYRLWQLKEATRACYDIATIYGTPFISGKDSMFNDFSGFDANGNSVKISIPPTLLISAIGVVPDILKTISLDAKMPGDLIYILGETHNELLGSEYFSMIAEDNGNVGMGFKPIQNNDVAQIPVVDASVPPLSKERVEPALSLSKGGVINSTIPTVDAQKNYKLYKALFSAIQKNLIASSISVSRGGLAIALCKMLAGGGFGGNINLKNLPGTWSQNFEALFSESTGRILVTVDAKKENDFKKIMAGNIFTKIGKVIDNKNIIISDEKNKTIVNLKIHAALKAYKKTFKNF